MPSSDGWDPTPEDPDEIVVAGVQRTGSTWLRTLLERNIVGEDITYRRVHSPVLEPDADAYFVIMRDPWAWLTRFYEFQLHPVFGFVDRLWNRILHPPVDRFRAFRWWNSYLLQYESWERTLPEERTAWVKYLDLLEEPEARLSAMLEATGVPHHDEVRRQQSYTKDFSSPLAKLFSPERFGSDTFDPSFYTEKEYLDDYRDSHMHELYDMAERRRLADRFERFGYDLAEDLPEA